MTAEPAIEAFLPAVRAALAENRPLLLTAEPGAGKTTLVPPALLDEPWLAGRKILVLEPRRVAARAAATRMAFLRGEEPGRTFGWRMAQDTCVGPHTRLEVITEGVLTRLIQNDPELTGVGLVLFDEYHERSLHADLGFALCLDVRKALRPDLRLGLLSATLDRELVQARLTDLVAVHAPGRVFPVTTSYRPAPEGTDDWSWAAQKVRDGWSAVAGSLLVFLPGAAEIRKVQEVLDGPARAAGEVVEVLHGSLSSRDQARVLEALPNGRRKTVLATAVAETSVTIPGVELVIDPGWARLGRYDQGRALERLVTERVSQASADQRRGRAGRTGPGACWRLWPEREHLPPSTDPEMRRADLAPLVLECAVWGARETADLDWMTPPSAPAWTAAREQLSLLEALDDHGAVTSFGKQLAALGVGPRLGRMLLRAREANREVALACAVLLTTRDRTPGSDCDVRLRLEAALSPTNADAARQLRQKLGWPGSGRLPAGWESVVGETLLGAYPDRVAFRLQTTGASATFQLPSGRVVRVRGQLAAEETLVIPEADAGAAGTGQVWMAAPLDRLRARSLLGPAVTEVVELEWQGWRARAFRVRRLGALAFEMTGLSLASVAPELKAAVRARLAEGVELPWNAASHQLVLRLKALNAGTGAGSGGGWVWLADYADLAGPVLFTERLVHKALTENLPYELRRRLEAEVPETLVVPSGSRRPLEYREDGESGAWSVHLEVRIQEVFGLAASPQIAGKPLVLHLLSPGHKPLQITADLASFWQTTYPEVRKQMRGRYPRHYWPDNPLEAEPTSRPKPKTPAK